MDEEALNLSIRKFLKMVGVNSQREIEHAVAKALAERRIAGSESFPATMTLKVGGLELGCLDCPHELFLREALRGRRRSLARGDLRHGMEGHHPLRHRRGPRSLTTTVPISDLSLRFSEALDNLEAKRIYEVQPVSSETR